MEKIKYEGTTKVFLPSKALCIHGERAARHARREILGVVRHVNRLMHEGDCESLEAGEVLASATLSVFFRILMEHSREKDIENDAVSHYINVVAHAHARLARELDATQARGPIQ